MRRFSKYLRASSAMAASLGTAAFGFLHLHHQKNMIPHDQKYFISSKESDQINSSQEKANMEFYLAPYLPPSREQMIENMKKDRFDVLVIGGGATGSGVTLDLATRGIKCCLVEIDDFASGTSSRSTKLLHGGIRYLQKVFQEFDLKQLYLVWEALEERAHDLACAPYMNHPVALLMPIYKYWQVPYFWVGVKFYGLLSKFVCCFSTGVPPSSYISAETSRFSFPLLPSSGLKGSLLYFDGQMNDSRFNLNIALTSTLQNFVDGFTPANIANHIQIISFYKCHRGKIVGAKVKDNISGQEFDIHCKAVVNCSGPFVDEVRLFANENTDRLVEPAKGIHLVLPHWYTCFSPFGLLLPETSDGRVLLVLPWEGHTLVGTTDALSTLSHNPAPDNVDINWLCSEIGEHLRMNPERIKDDILSAWCGLRPLVSDPSKSDTKSLVRSHAIIVDEKTGMITCTGGKWTTYRRMAQETVDKLLEIHADKLASKSKCRTNHMKILGAVDPTGELEPEDCIAESGKLLPLLQKLYPNLEFDQLLHLVHSYGFMSRDVLTIGKNEDLMYRLCPEMPYVAAEVVYACRYEMAQTIPDVIGRRLRIAFLDSKKAQDSIDKVGSIMARELNWSADIFQLRKEEAKKFLQSFPSPEECT